MLRRIVAPAISPVTVAEVKSLKRFELDAEDTDIASFIEAATEKCEASSLRPLITATYQYTTSSHCSPIVLTIGNLQEITSVVDEDGNALEYEVDDTHLLAEVTVSGSYEKCVITFVAGYGDEAEDVPATGRQAVRTLAAHYWSDRDKFGPMPEAVAALLDPIRIVAFS